MTECIKKNDDFYAWKQNFEIGKLVNKYKVKNVIVESEQ